MSFKCNKCLRVKPSKFFTKLLNEPNICDFCRNAIEENAIKRKHETPALKNYGDTPEAKKAVKTRRSIEEALEDRALAKEIEGYE